MTPSEVNTFLWERGFPDVGQWLQVQLQLLEQTQAQCQELREYAKSLEKMLPQDVQDERARLIEEKRASRLRDYGRRAPAQSDG